MASPESISEKALITITAIKLEELEIQRLEYQGIASAIFDSKESNTEDNKESLLQNVESLIVTITHWKGPGKLEGTTVGGKLELSNLKFWMEQARREASFDLSVIQGWKETLETHIRHISTRFDCAKLVGEMYIEWVDSDDIKVVSLALKEAGEVEVKTLDEDFDMMLDAPGSIGPRSLPEEQGAPLKDMETAAKEKVLSVILEEHTTDIVQLMAYLDNLFSTEDAAVALSQVRTSLHKFGSGFGTETLWSRTIAQAIRDLLATGLMNEEQSVMLRQLRSNHAALEEVGNVVRMRLANFKSWAWPKAGLEIAMRKHVNDNFRVFMVPEVIDAILWEYVGNAWRKEIKNALRKIFESNAWNRPKVSEEQYSIINKIGSTVHDSINTKRDNLRSQVFLLPNLPNVPYAQESLHRKDKRQLLHLMATESRLNSVLRGSHTMVHARSKNFENSLSHQAILIVLAYLGVPEHWLSTFHSFLAMPILCQEAPTTRTCKRGIPYGYTLGVVFGEVIMHIMDFAANQKAHGIFLYRMQDHIWFWDANSSDCSNAWREMQYYASLVGIDFDNNNMGVASLGTKLVAEDLSPVGDVKWGFLKFDLNKVGFVIDQGEVDLQIIEFCRRLAETKSIFGWIEMYNKYMAHFWINFGGIPAKCLGDAHVDDMIKTFTKIQEEVFSGPNVGPVGFLRKVLGERFGVYELPDGYFFFPVRYGGLDVYNVMLSLTSLERERKAPVFSTAPHEMPISLHQSDTPYLPAESRFGFQFYSDLKDYVALKARWESARPGRKTMLGEEDFVTFNDYVSLRECHLTSWGKIYDGMLNDFRTKEVAPARGGNPTYFASAMRRWHTMDLYSRWLVSLYGEEVIKKFGSLDIVDEAQVPVGIPDLCGSFRTHPR